MDTRNSLVTLAEFSLRSAASESDKLAVYDAVATIATALNSGDCALILATARDAGIAIRRADELQLQFRDLVSGGGNGQ